ncbi:MAG TPA: serine/threonine-protein kinase [Gemmatimonadaceae bacterium]
MTSPTKTCPQCGTTYDFEQRFCPRDGSTLRAPAGSDLVGSVLADRYHIMRRIGEGGMGQVYLAEHVRMKRRSAVKVLHQGMVNDPEAIARFNREASNASQIQHPNVAAIYDFGETADGLIYLAMEYIDGEPLTRIIEREGALSAARAAEITRQVASALEAAHDMGIIHRDLKPDNIMIARGRNGEDVAKVVDFGIAKAVQADDQNVTRTGLAIGTPEYMSPEQLGGDRLDTRTDIYSLGLVAFNMLTGQLPFPSVTSREALIARLTERPRTLAEIKDDVAWPAELQGVMDRALASAPTDRYQHVTQFGRDLGRAVANMPGSALSGHGTLRMTPVPTVRPLGASAPSSALAPTPPEGAPAQAPAPAPAGDRRRTPLITGAVARRTEPETGRGVLVAFIVLAAVALGGGGFLYWRSTQKPAAPTSRSAAVAPAPSSPTADSATVASTSVDSARIDSAPRIDSASAGATADGARPDSAHLASASRPAPAPAPEAPKEKAPTAPASAPAQLLAPIRDDIAVGRQRMSDGQYEGALVRFGQASDKLRALVARYPDDPDVKSLRRDLDAARSANRDACRAERALAERRGEAGPDCP